MKRRLPPFAAIKAFEAAARHCNFQLAAEELSISASAVSHQVKSLEEYVGMSLFMRKNNRLFLRDEGQIYYNSLSKILDEIENSTNTLVRTLGVSQVVINLYPSLADLWLVPNLPGFYKEHSDISVRLNTSILTADVMERDADFAILYQPVQTPTAGGIFLFEDEVIPVATPSFLANNNEIRWPDDLLDQTLIVSHSEDGEWESWFAANNIQKPDGMRMVELDMTSSVLQAVTQGLGIALGRRPYMDEALKSGELVPVFKDKIATGYCLRLITTKRGQRLVYANRLQDWIVTLARQSTKIW